MMKCIELYNILTWYCMLYCKQWFLSSSSKLTSLSLLVLPCPAGCMYLYKHDYIPADEMDRQMEKLSPVLIEIAATNPSLTWPRCERTSQILMLEISAWLKQCFKKGVYISIPYKYRPLRLTILLLFRGTALDSGNANETVIQQVGHLLFVARQYSFYKLEMCQAWNLRLQTHQSMYVKLILWRIYVWAVNRSTWLTKILTKSSLKMLVVHSDPWEDNRDMWEPLPANLKPVLVTLCDPWQPK